MPYTIKRYENQYYNYVPCPRCKSESILEDKHHRTGEEIFQCEDCGYYKTKSKEIDEPLGAIHFFRNSTGRKLVKTIENEEEYNSFVTPLINDHDVTYLMFSTFWVCMIKRTYLK